MDRLVQRRVERAAFFQADGQDVRQLRVKTRHAFGDVFVARGRGGGVLYEILPGLEDQHDHGMGGRRRFHSRVAGVPCKRALDVLHEHRHVAKNALAAPSDALGNGEPKTRPITNGFCR